MAQSTIMTEKKNFISKTENPDPDTTPDNFPDNVSYDRFYHIVDMAQTESKIATSIKKIPLINQPLSYLIYLGRLITYLFLTLFFNWTIPLVNPLNFILTFIVFPLFSIFLFFFELGLKIGAWIQSLSRTTNVGVIELWDSLSDYLVVKNLQKGLDSLDYQGNDDKESLGFNLDRAEFLLWLSSIMAERNQDIVDEAYKKIVELKNDTKQDIQVIIDLLIKSEKSIREQAERFGLKFLSVTECNSVGGPYGGFFWSDNHNFIVLAFKGTDTYNIAEWLTDFNLERMDARSFLFGEVHEGFYTSLFPDNSHGSVKFRKQCPAVRLTEAIRRKAAEIYRRSHERVNLWIAGYSLGAALASLMYIRILSAPGSVGEHVDLRDGFAFACPVIGDSDFSAGYRHLENQSKNVNNNLWRIINDNDMVPRGLPGFHVDNLGHYLSKVDFFNYVVTGDDVKFYQDGSEPSSERHLYGPDPTSLTFHNGNFDSPGLRSFLGLSESNDRPFRERVKKLFRCQKDQSSEGVLPTDRFTPSPILNHQAYRYFEVMEKSRKYWDQKNAIENPVHAPTNNSSPV